MAGLDAPLQESIAGRRSLLGLSAPSPWYLTGEELLRITTVGNTAGLTLTIAGRLLTPDNVIHPFEFPHTPNSNRTPATTIQNLSEGWLLGIEVKVTGGTLSFGGVWCLLELVRGQGSAAKVVQALTNDFATPVSPLFWPGESAINSLEGAGNLRAIVGTTPGAGVDISETVPSSTRWELLAFLSTLTSAVAVANRVPMLILDDGTNTFHEVSDQQNQAASLVWDYTFAQGAAYKDAGNRLLVSAPLPIGNRLSAGFRIRTNTLALQAADQWTAPKYLVREWFDI